MHEVKSVNRKLRGFVNQGVYGGRSAVACLAWLAGNPHSHSDCRRNVASNDSKHIVRVWKGNC